MKVFRKVYSVNVKNFMLNSPHKVIDAQHIDYEFLVASFRSALSCLVRSGVLLEQVDADRSSVSHICHLVPSGMSPKPHMDSCKYVRTIICLPANVP